MKERRTGSMKTEGRYELRNNVMMGMYMRCCMYDCFDARMPDCSPPVNESR